MTQFFYRNGAPVPSDTKITLKKENSTTGTILEHFACNRCGGEGGNRVWNHTGYTCYRCGGKTRILPGRGYADPTSPKKVSVYTEEKLNKLNEAKAKKEAKKAAAIAEKEEKFFSEYGEIIEAAKYYASRNSFVASVLETVIGKQEMSEKQESALIKAFATTQKWINAEEKKAAVDYFGKVGERITRELTLKVVNVYEGDFGPFYIAIYNDDEGNTFVYKGSTPKGTKGEKASFTFTIKEHSEYKGKKNNIVAHIKINR